MLDNFKAFQKILAQLGYILQKRQKRDLIKVFAAMIVEAFLELLSVSVIAPFLQIMLDESAIRDKWYISWIYRLNPGISNVGVLLSFGIAIILLFLIKNAVGLGCAYIRYKFGTRIQKELSVHMLRSYLKRPYSFFLNTNSSEILRGIENDMESVYLTLLYILENCSFLLVILFIAVFLFVTDWFTALCSLVLVGACFLGVTLFFKKRMKSAGRAYRAAVADQKKFGYQSVHGIKEIMILNRREAFVGQYEEAAERTAGALLTNNFVTACPDRVLEGVCIGGLIGVLCVRIALGVDMTRFTPVLGTFAMGAFKILPSISKVSARLNHIIFYQPSVHSFYENYKKAEEFDRENDALIEKEKELEAGTETKQFEKELRLNGLGFRYENSKKEVISDLSMVIRKGEAVAFIGSSGAGKTTLADIIMGLLKPQKGKVLIDGTDVSDIPHLWCRMIGYVPQSVFLTDDTVRANIAFGLPKERIFDDRVWAALEKAQIRDFIEKLPDKLDTIVGERGIKFSGGQRQRIALARALYEDPDILVLDEATSSLDTETETAVMESIDALHGHKTLIIIAHRLSTIRNCDRAYEVRDGVAIERKISEIDGINGT